MNKHLALPPGRPARGAGRVTPGVTGLRNRANCLIEGKFLVLNKGLSDESGADTAGGCGNRFMTQSKAHSGLMLRMRMLQVHGAPDPCRTPKWACAKDDSVAVRAL